MRWRLYLTEPLDATENMALDEALMLRARTSGEYVFRVYGWSEPTLSLGRNQRAVGVFDKQIAECNGVAIVRRLTGGRAVLHHREVTYSVTGPALHDTLRTSYAGINRILLAALQSLGVRAALAHARSERFPPPASSPCFELPAEGEIVLGARKLVGSAQVREGGAFLQHGSILVDDDQSRVPELSSVSIPHAAPAATLRDALGSAPSLHDVAKALFSAVRLHADADAAPLHADAQLHRATRAARTRYVDDSWTWRR
ncbi:MAG TPA: lipoate--protein ligase family protein [Gemmatimonadaceae bacterium]|nr:lipoate--protein ligase family protein [Gemmatimonadaceae bacterium]